jgi:TRAP-type C4-dicarboxylate transport system substrate-binding protein
MKRSRSLRRFVWLGAALALVLAVLTAACEDTSPDAPARVYELRISHHLPPATPLAVVLEEWARKVQEQTGGRVKFTIYPSGSLVGSKQALEATEHGVCDVAFVNLTFAADRWSLNTVLTLGTLKVPSERGAEIWDQLWERFPEMKLEIEDSVHVLAKSISKTDSIHVVDREIHVPEDIKGLKIAGMGESLSVLRQAGAVPVSIEANDYATSAERGLIVGSYAPISVLVDRGMETTFDSHLNLGLENGGDVIVMNKRTWNRLPQDLQEVFNRLGPELSEAIRQASVQLEEESWAKCAGQLVVVPTAEEETLWMACYRIAADQWIEDNATKGPSQEIYDYLEQLIER